VYSPLAGGRLTGKYRKGETGRIDLMGKTGQHTSPVTEAVIDYLIVIADELNATPGQVAIAWVSAKGGFPIIGPRTRSQLNNNLKAATIKLSKEHLDHLNEISAISLGYPHETLARV